ncbi:MAG: DNA repair protein RecO C-terminal domain-containing protein [Pseudomonadota bacterium]|nr:DNA repair protein RecO C-terminal domain-containing protein [Pseudomonadota bacterium]
MNNLSIDCYPIYERPYTDRIKFVHVFSCEQGMISLTVPAKRNINFFLSYQAIATGKKLVLQSPTEHPLPLQGKTLFCGLYLNELIYRFCKPSDPHPDIYLQYKHSLAQLRKKEHVESSLRLFEIRLLKACGYEIDTHHIQQPYVVFDKDQGLTGSPEPSDECISLDSLNKMLHHLQPSNEVKRFFRHVLNSLLPTIIQSRQLYEKVT